MKGKHCDSNIDFDESYDQESDIYYVTFRTGEPSYCKEVDDILILEMGIFTNLPTGFRLLNFSKLGRLGIAFFKKIKKTIEDNVDLTKLVKSREHQVEHAIHEVLK